MVLQGHFHHSGILCHCIRTYKKQLQLDMSGELITSWLLAASRLLVRGRLDTTGLLVRGGLDTTGLLVRGGLDTTGLLVRGGLDTTGLLVMREEHHREYRLQLLLSRPSIIEKFPQIVLRGEGDWEQRHFLAVDITNLRDPTSLHHLFQGGSDGVEGETEAGVAAAEGEFSVIGAPNLSGLAVDGD